MSRQELVGKKIAVLLNDHQSNGSVETTLMDGMIEQVGEGLGVNYDDTQPLFPLLPEWWERIKPVPIATRHLLADADFVLSLQVGPRPPEANPADFGSMNFCLPPSDEV